MVPTGGPEDAWAFPEHVPEILRSAHRGTQQVLARYSARPRKSVACQLEVLPRPSHINPFLTVRDVLLVRFLRLAVGLEQHYATCVLLDLRDPSDFVLHVDQGRINP